LWELGWWDEEEDPVEMVERERICHSSCLLSGASCFIH